MNIPGKPFTDVLGEIENGSLLRDLTEEVYNIVAATLETRKAGKLKLTLSFLPTGKGLVEIAAKYDADVPEHDRPSTSFFVSKDFALHRNDPDQPRLPLQEVAKGNSDLRTA